MAKIYINAGCANGWNAEQDALMESIKKLLEADETTTHSESSRNCYHEHMLENDHYCLEYSIDSSF